MSKESNIESDDLAEFDLKHRVTGAAVLLFFGALVLPWLLGPPSEASKVDLAEEQVIESDVEPAEIVVASSGSRDISSIDDIEETVYISKITPLDARKNRDNKTVDKPKPESQTQATTKGSDTSAQESSKALEALVAEQKAGASGEQSNTSDAAQAADQTKEALAESKVDSDSERVKRERELQAALAAELEAQKRENTDTPAKTNTPKVAKESTVDVGWVVQVGLFTEKSRALTLINDLKNKGFKASSSVVDTNRGKNTGTRVWLGPFGKRVSAVSEQKRLKSKAGKDGFIRVYP